MAVSRPTIMVTKDDGIDAPGLRELVKILVSTGLYRVFVSAPSTDKSGVGHGITWRPALCAKRVEIEGATAFAVSDASYASKFLNLYGTHEFSGSRVLDGDENRIRDLDAMELLNQLPALQQLLFHLLGCQPQGAAIYNFVIQLPLSMVAAESIKIYNAISDGTINLVDKFFEMQRHDAVKALEIYRKAGQQIKASDMVNDEKE